MKDYQLTSVGVQTELTGSIMDDVDQPHHHHQQQQQQQQHEELIAQLQSQLDQLQLGQDVVRNERDLVSRTSVSSCCDATFSLCVCVCVSRS